MIKLHNLPDNENKASLYSVTVNEQPIDCAFARVSAMPFNTPWPGHQRDLSQTEKAAFRNITYRNCNLIHDNFGAMMRIHHHNRAEIYNITYENMHCEFCVDQMM